MYTAVNPFYYIKVEFKGIKIILACFHDDNRAFVSATRIVEILMMLQDDCFQKLILSDKHCIWCSFPSPTAAHSNFNIA